MTNPHHPEHNDRGRSAQTRAQDTAEDAELHGSEGATRGGQGEPPTVDYAGLEPPESRPTLGYVAGESEGLEVSAHTRELPSVPGYELLGVLGRGAMGVVYRARQEGLKRVVALKMILAGSHAGPEQLARFQTEAEAVAQLQHPNIVQIFDVGKHTGLPFFSLEFVDGRSLERTIRGKPQLPARAAELVECLARAMHYAHQQGIVHRDLKPANVLLTREGVPKISDFGLVKRVEDDSSQTETGTILGTPSYMAPEQARGEREILPAADVYALGAVLYSLLTGRPPFLAATSIDTVLQVLHEEPVPPSQLSAKTPRDLETICIKCLQKDIEKRYADAEQLAEDLRRFQAGEPILARPVSGPERFWRWCRRNPRVATLSAAILLLLVTIAAGSFASAVRIASERDVAEGAREDAEDERQKAEAARDEAQAARKEADLHAEAAGEQRLVALEALRTLVQEVQHRLKDFPELHQLRTALLDTAMKGLDDVTTKAQAYDLSEASMKEDHQRMRLRYLAGAQQRMGDVYLLLGEPRKAIEQFRQSERIVHALAKAVPEDPILACRNPAAVCVKLAQASLRMQNSAEALKYLEKSAGLREQWVASEPDNLAAKLFLAGGYAELAGALLRSGNPAAARRYGQEALDIRLKWCELDPKRSKPLLECAVSYQTMGEVSLKLGEEDTARQNYDKHIQLMDRLAAALPQNSSIQWNRAVAYVNLGDACVLLQDYDAALGHYLKAHRWLTEITAGNPDSADAARNLSVACYALGAVSLKLGDQAQANEYFNDCLKLRETLRRNDPTDIRAQVDLMLAQARCRQHTEAVQIAASLRQDDPKDPALLYNIACCYGLCAGAIGQIEPIEEADPEKRGLKESYMESAIQVLGQAIGLGWKDLFSLKNDPDLDPLRDRPEFETLLRGLEQSLDVTEGLSRTDSKDRPGNNLHTRLTPAWERAG